MINLPFYCLMKLFLKKKKDLNPVAWSGGTTTELMIWPQGTSYADRNFGFRISTSAVEQETSVFTNLEGIHRQIMLLEGEMTLEHNDLPGIILRKFFTHSFEGGWKTVSFGRCRDFNLMTREGFSGHMEGLVLKKEDQVEIPDQIYFSAIYVEKGRILVNRSQIMERGDFLFSDNGDQPGIVTFTVREDAEIVLIKIQAS